MSGIRWDRFLRSDAARADGHGWLCHAPLQWMCIPQDDPDLLLEAAPATLLDWRGPEDSSPAMPHPDTTALEALSRDYSETPRRVLFVLGSGQSPAVEVFEAAAQQRSTSIDPAQLAEMAAGRRRSLTLSTPMQRIPEIVRSLALNNVAVYQVQLLEA
jgi:hypothetical protein